MSHQRSPHGFKSPTYLANTGNMPPEMKDRIRVPRTRTPEAAAFDARVVGMLNQLMASVDFRLPTLEVVFPLPYVHVVPSRHATVIFSAYSCALAERFQHPPPATIDEMNEYADAGDYWTENMIRDKLFLYKIISPFRTAYGYPPRRAETARDRVSKGFPFRRDQMIPQPVRSYQFPPETMDLLRLHSTPSLIIANVGAKLRREGYASALGYVRGLRRASEKIALVLREAHDFPKIPGIVVRYLAPARGPARPAIPPQPPQPPPPQQAPAFCPNCGARLQPDQSFCSQCGSKTRAA